MTTPPNLIHSLDLIAIIGEVPPWTLEETLPLLALLEDNGWAAMAEHGDMTEEEWTPYDRAAAARRLSWTGRVDLRQDGRTLVRGTLANVGANSIRLELEPQIYADAPTERLEATLARMIATIPAWSSARARVDYDDRAYLRGFHGFRQLGWLHVLAPRMYTRYFEREALLAAPCRVEEREGNLWFWLYDHPSKYQTPEALAARRALTDYLAAHVKP
jgi:hypothetical protein